MCSEYIIEEVAWSDGFPYSESNIHKTIMPKYYNELSVTEKNAIIRRRFPVFSELIVDGEKNSANSYEIQSYFYAPDLGELNATVIHSFTAAFTGGIVDSWARLGNYKDNQSRIKTFKNGDPGGYLTTSTIYDFDSGTNSSEAYDCSIDKSGSGLSILVGVVDGGNGPGFFSDNAPVNVLPFCDIKGDTIVEKDLDGYWRIIEAPEDIPVEPPKIFGIQRDITNPSPEWTRTGDAVGMTATASVGNTAGRSDFDKCMPWAGMVRETLSTGDVMVKIPKFYYRRYREGNIEHIEIADKPVEGFSVHPSFNHTGLEKDFIYIGAYKTSSNNKSISGATPQVNQLRSVMRNNAHSKGEGWNIIDISTLSAIQMLFLVEYATNDSQKAIGRGYVDGNSSILQTGTCDNVLNLTGIPTGTNGKVDVIYRGIEGLWGNIREWVDGINFNNREIWVCNNPSQYADDISTNYTKLSYNLINNTGYITELGIDQEGNKHIMLPFNSGGSNSTYYPDYVNGNINNRTWRVLNIGGGLQGNSDAGLFCSYGDFGSTNSHDRVGSRLLYIPSPTEHSGGVTH